MTWYRFFLLFLVGLEASHNNNNRNKNHAKTKIDSTPILFKSTTPSLSVQSSLLERLDSYWPYYCTTLRAKNKLWEPTAASIEEAIKTVDLETLKILDQMLPMNRGCETPLWSIFYYRNLLISSSEREFDYAFLIQEYKELFSKAKLQVKNAAMEILKNVNDNSLNASVQKYIDEADFEKLLRGIRSSCLGDVNNPANHQIARIIIAIIECDGKLDHQTSPLPRWMFYTMKLVHLIDDITSEKAIVTSFLHLVDENELDIGPWLYHRLIIFAQKEDNVYSIIDAMIEMERLIQVFGPESVFKYYVLYSEFGAKFLANVLKDTGYIFFRDYPLEKVQPKQCGREKTLKDCISILSNHASNHRLLDYQPPKKTDPVFNDIVCELDQFEFDKTPIGKGTYGTVYKATHKETKVPVAIKKTLKATLESMAQSVIIEDEITATVKHENIGSAYCSFMSQGNHYLVMPYYLGGSLDDKIQKGKRKQHLTEITIVRYVQLILEGIMALHTQGFLHNDLKPANILFDNKGTLKIVDFGLSCPLQFDTNPFDINSLDISTLKLQNNQIESNPMQRKKSQIHTSSLYPGTYEFMPGEVLVGRNHGPATDIYSVGVIAWTLLEGGYYNLQQTSIKPFEFGRLLTKGQFRWMLRKELYATKEFQDLILTLTSSHSDDRWKKVYVEWEAFQKNSLFKSPWKGNPVELLEKVNSH